MKKLVLTLFLVLLFSSQNTFAQTQEPLKAQLTMQDVVVFSNNKNTLFGLKDKSGNIVVDAQEAQAQSEYDGHLTYDNYCFTSEYSSEYDSYNQYCSDKIVNDGWKMNY